MAGETLDFEHLVNPDTLGVEIGNKYREWDNLRQGTLGHWKELRNYLYATDTRTTSNALLPWSNSTTTPKLTQIYDNLHANYTAALFPSMKWMRWEGGNQADNAREKRRVIQAYMENKLKQSSFVDTALDLVSDYIQYGNCFGAVEWVDNYKVTQLGEVIDQYVGPRLVRISPYDIVFNPTASSFEKTPKIIRSIVTLGEIARKVKKNPEDGHLKEVLDKMTYARNAIRGGTEVHKSEGFVADGFSSIQHYYSTDYVEILTFYGDMYDIESGEFHEDRIITIVDRAHVLSNEPNPSWLGHSAIFHAGWRKRPDNLYAMGPLDNLVGMQYRIDHLENLKADVFDMIAYPIAKIRGDVEDWDYEPGSRIYMGEEGDVGYLVPDATALNADLQIQALENKMEEMAGAPRQAMGIRTPGEKTAFEVSTLDNAASRIFTHKTAHLERTFVEPVLNAMLEAARRHMNTSDTIRVIDDATGVALFRDITKADIVGSGRIIPVGARHFAERARRVQNITQLYQIKAADPTVSVHLSGKEFARIMAEELGEPTLFSENIQVQESMETQQEQQNAEVLNEEQLALGAEEGF